MEKAHVKILCSLLFSFFFCVTVVRAEVVCDGSGGACFPTFTEINGVQIPLQRISRFTYWGFKVYAAALYIAPEYRTAEGVLLPVPKQLSISYYRDFSAKDFITSGKTVIEQNPTNILSEFAKELSEFDLLYQPVKTGDRYDIQFLSEKAVRLLLNGKNLGTVSDPSSKFQRAYFGIWLSKYSIGESFTERLVGK